jgi:hypothetical protein
VLLRSIAEMFYPYREDEADYFVEDLEAEGFDVAFDFADLPIPRFDVRLLGLIDGMVCVTDTFDEVLWSDEEPHAVLTHNAARVVDFVFPEQVLELTGIRGIRIHELDLVCWLKEGADRRVLAFEENQDVWLDELAVAERRAAAVDERHTEERARLRAKRFPIETSSDPAVSRSAANLDEMLEELSAMVDDMAA